MPILSQNTDSFMLTAETCLLLSLKPDFLSVSRNVCIYLKLVCSAVLNYSSIAISMKNSTRITWNIANTSCEQNACPRFLQIWMHVLLMCKARILGVFISVKCFLELLSGALEEIIDIFCFNCLRFVSFGPEDTDVHGVYIGTVRFELSPRVYNYTRRKNFFSSLK